MTDKIPCPECGKPFVPWRGKQFCSERCRKRSENKRLRASAARSVADLEPVRGDDTRKDTSQALRGDQTALAEPLVELADGIRRIESMPNPTIAAIRRELAGWNITDDHTVNTIARRMRVAPPAVREALGLIPPRCG